MPGQRGTVGAGALHTGPPQYPERARPAQQRVVAGSTGRERLGVPQHAQRGDDRCHVQILMGIGTENDFLGAAAVLVVSPGWGMLVMVVCLLIATEPMAIARPAWAVRTVTVPC